MEILNLFNFKFVQLLIQAAIGSKIIKPFDVLTLQEALDLARVLLKFLIEHGLGKIGKSQYLSMKFA